MNESEQNKITTSGQSETSTLKISKLNEKKANVKMDRETLHHWGATREIMDIIGRYNSPEIKILVVQRNALSRTATLRRRYDHETQRTIFAPSRPNKRSRKEIAEIDAEFTPKANRIGRGYQPIAMEEEHEKPEEIREEGEMQTSSRD